MRGRGLFRTLLLEAGKPDARGFLGGYGGEDAVPSGGCGKDTDVVGCTDLHFSIGRRGQQPGDGDLQQEIAQEGKGIGYLFL